MRKIRLLVISSAMALAIMGGASIASADDNSGAFLCPIVGDGVINAAAHSEGNGLTVIDPPAGTSLLPGKNQAGANANHNAHNALGPGNPDAGPGGNPDFSPIWPG